VEPPAPEPQDPPTPPPEPSSAATSDPDTPTPPPTGTSKPDPSEWERRYGVEARERRKLEKRLADLETANQSDSEKAVAAARAEGHSEALKTAGARLAAAEFRAQAAGKLADPAAAVEYLDMAKFVTDDGEPDTDAIGQAVERLVAAASSPGGSKPKPPTVPNGAQAPAASADSDWLRSVASTT
jgi:hypothetical protein